jgi:hypothetical protein
VLTVLTHNVKIGTSVIEHCCFLITQKLLDLEDVSCLRLVELYIRLSLNHVDLSDCRSLREDLDCGIRLWEFDPQAMYKASYPWIN